MGRLENGRFDIQNREDPRCLRAQEAPADFEHALFCETDQRFLKEVLKPLPVSVYTVFFTRIESHSGNSAQGLRIICVRQRKLSGR